MRWLQRTLVSYRLTAARVRNVRVTYNYSDKGGKRHVLKVSMCG